MTSIYEKVINYLLENPGAKPRQIADGIGESLTRVRKILYILRDKGIIARSGQGYVVVKSRLTRKQYEEERTRSQQENNITPQSSMQSVNRLDKQDVDSKWLSEIISNIMKSINELNKKMNVIEKEIANIKTRLDAIEGKNKIGKGDKFIALIKQKKIMSIEEARQYMSKSLDYYVVNNYVSVIGNMIIDRGYFETFKKKFPLKVSEVKKLNSNEILLLKKLIEEGVVYLHGGSEYRFIE